MPSPFDHANSVDKTARPSEAARPGSVSGVHPGSASDVRPNQRFVWLGCLRAFGVILVLTYHFFPAVLPGGFIGVDVFFVFSGFLITSLLIREFIDEDHIGLPAFYIRRLRRLGPAVLVCVLITLPSALFISPDYRVQIAQQTAAALSWTTNFYEIAADSSYADVLLPHLFAHTWTLSIEMQYYLIWGAALFFVLPLTLRRLGNGRLSLAFSRKVLLITTGATALVSYVLMQVFLAADAAAAIAVTDAATAVAGAASTPAVASSAAASAAAAAASATADTAATAAAASPIVFFPDPSFAYFNTLSHVYPLMIGSAAGVVAGYPRTRLVRWVEQKSSRLALAVVTVCLAAIGVLARFSAFDEPLAFTFGILATSLLCLVVIVVGRGMQKRLARYREPRILTWLAETSYSLYLFHWPALVIFAAWGQALATVTGPGVGAAIMQIANIVALALTFALARLSYRYVEKPFSMRGEGFTRLRALLWARRDRAQARRGRIVAGAVAGVVVLLGIAALTTAPLLSSMDVSLRQGAVALQSERLEEAHAALARLDKLHRDSGAVYVGQGMTDRIKRGSVTFIGDSVAVFPGSVIAEKTGAYVDAEVGRSMESGVPLILSMQASGTLGEDVVVALATNTHVGSLAAARELCEQIAPGHRLVLVTSHGVGDGDMAALNAGLRELAAEFPFVTIADWDSAIASHEDWLASDGYHCGTQEAIDLYVQVVLDALDAARLRPMSGEGQ
jgi:peptidoglycan/LPS O-acetylase OafA/YrhL